MRTDILLTILRKTVLYFRPVNYFPDEPEIVITDERKKTRKTWYYHIDRQTYWNLCYGIAPTRFWQIFSSKL